MNLFLNLSGRRKLGRSWLRDASPRSRSRRAAGNFSKRFLIYGNQNVVKGLKPMLRRLTRFKILASSLCVVFAGAFAAQGHALCQILNGKIGPANRGDRYAVVDSVGDSQSIADRAPARDR